MLTLANANFSNVNFSYANFSCVNFSNDANGLANANFS